MNKKFKIRKDFISISALVFIVSMSLAHAQEDLSFYDGRALMQVINAEYKARATYKYVVDDIGKYRPFPRLVKLKERHIEYIKELLRRYDLEVPNDNWKDIEPKYANLKEACQDGIEVEHKNAMLYGRLLTKVKNEEVKQFLERIKKFSLEDFVKDFNRCLKDSEID